MVFKLGETDIKRKTRDSNDANASINPPSTTSNIESLNEPTDGISSEMSSGPNNTCHGRASLSTETPPGSADEEETVRKREEEVMNQITGEEYFYASCFGRNELDISDQEEEPDLAQRKSDMDFLA